MGDRINIGLHLAEPPDNHEPHQPRPGTLFVYGHWAGHVWPRTLQDALKRVSIEGRWGDTGYAARMIVDQLTIQGRDRSTGYGLYVDELGDNEHPILFVDLHVPWDHPAGVCLRANYYHAIDWSANSLKASWSCEDYVQLTIPDNCDPGRLITVQPPEPA